MPLVVERDDLPFTSRCTAGQRIVIPVKHGDGRWFAPPELVRELEANRQVVLRYGEPCNGSVDDIAGICNERGNVMGLMPHPEHAVDPLLGSADGALLLASLVEAAREHALASSNAAIGPSASASAGFFASPCAQPLDVTLTKRDRAAPRGAVGGVREADKPLAVRGLEQLHDRGEAPLARLLADRQLLDELCRAPGCRRLRRHTSDGTRKAATEV